MMIPFLLFFLTLIILGRFIYLYLRKEQSKAFISKDKHDEAWDEYNQRKKIISQKRLSKASLSALSGIFKILIFVGVLIFISVYIFLISFTHGSLRGFLAEYRTLPKEKKLESLRSDAIEQITQAHAEFNSFTGLTLYEKTYSDMCAKGDHSWKREDPFANICSYRLTYYYGTNRAYKELLLDLEKTLPDLGWTTSWNPEQPTISESISEHTGKIFLVELPVYVKKFSDGTTYNYARLTINDFDDGGGHWAKVNREPSPLGFGVGMQQEVYRNESNKSPKEIFNKITSSGQYAIMIAISKVYFRN